MAIAEAPDPLHPLLRSRSSPRTFDAGHELAAGDVAVLLEAARWAPSAGNSQPWAFVAALRGGDAHARVVRHLARSSAHWAPSASLLVVNLAHDFVDEEGELEYSEFARYDLGQAVAHLTIQAQAMGLACRQFRAFDLDALAAELQLAPGWQVASMTAVGRPVTTDATDSSDDQARARRTVEELRTDALARSSPFAARTRPA
jgi:nitroreductase